MWRTRLFLILALFSTPLLTGTINAQADSSQIVFTGCPPYVEGTRCDSMYYSVVAVDLQTGRPVPGMKYFQVSGPGAVNEQTGLWVFHPETADTLPGYYEEVLIGANHGGDSTTEDSHCRFNLRISDAPPRITPRCGTRYTCLPGDTETVSLSITDADWCDAPRIDSVWMNPAPVGLFEFDADELVIRFMPDRADSGMTFTARVAVTSGRIHYHCFYYFDTFWPEATYSVRLGYQQDVIQGQYHDVPITLEEFDSTQGFAGFDFLIGYDASVLAFQLGYEGDIYDSCGWEFFTYRFSPYGNCGDACPSGMLRVIGLAETNNGPYYSGCQTPTPYVDDVPVVLANLRFLVSSDRTLECQFVPLRFFWYGCGDNTLSNYYGNELYLSSSVFDYGDTLVSGQAVFPTYSGSQDECVFSDPSRDKSAIRAVDFYNGGLQIVCADTIEVYGDINCNGLAYEIADAVMYSNYFMEGLAAFDYRGCSIVASDANRDGNTLTIEDFVYLIRVTIGEALPYDQITPSPNPATFTWNTVSNVVDLATVDTLGAVLLVVEGEVTPTLLADQMEMKYTSDSGLTRILIYSLEGMTILSGDLVSIPGASGIVEVQAATYDGRPVTVLFSDITDVDGETGNVPATFALQQNHPNPFNPVTTIAYDLPERADVRVTIYNVVGQVVRTLVDRSVSAGQHEAVWDGRDDSGQPVSSGVYIYRMTAGDFTQSRKMLLLK